MSSGRSAEDSRNGSATALRDNLEAFALAIVLVLVLRQFVVEAFKIPTGSMAPTLLGVHNELRCPNCGWVFTVGNKYAQAALGRVECPNCHWRWEVGSDSLVFAKPGWLWHRARSGFDGTEHRGTEAANCVPRGGSRIFVNKFLYLLRRPRRWEVAVFLYPFCGLTCKSCGWSGQVESLEGFRCPDCGGDDFEVVRKSYIKRVVGLPHEEIAIRNGDIYVNGSIARKPPAVQQRLWRHVFDSRYVPAQEVSPAWDFAGEPERCSRAGERGALRVDALSAPGAVVARFARPITDFCAYNAPGTNALMPGSSARTVGDCRVVAYVSPVEYVQGAAALLRVTDGEREFTLSVPLGDGGHAVLSDRGRTVAQARVRAIGSGEKAKLVLENYDDRVVAGFGGCAILTHEYASAPGQPGRAGVSVGAERASVLFERIIIQRDIHYLNAGASASGRAVYRLGEGQYFALGDNSPASSDSRYWPKPYLPQGDLIGEAFFVFWPIHEFSLLSFGAAAAAPSALP